MKLSMPGVCSEGGIRNAEIRIRASAKQTRTNGITTVGVDALAWVLSRSRDIGFRETNMRGLLSGSYCPPDNLPSPPLSVPRVIPTRYRFPPASIRGRRPIVFVTDDTGH